jgi:alpha-beta hydrolase superfamily lysophospholipase
MTHTLKAEARQERVVGTSGLNLLVRSRYPGRAARAVVVICHGFNAHGGQCQGVGEQSGASAGRDLRLSAAVATPPG